jgi:light-regulated signal transduction histidine kinase (bacteriophytochrome)
MRGPVASLLGLMQLVNESRLESNEREIFKHIQKSAISLDEVVKDLGSILDTRGSVTEVKETVDLVRELANVKSWLAEEITECEVIIQDDFEWNPIISVKPFINNILYQLIHNSIKYQYPNRQPVIRIASKRIGDECVLKIQDNGLGLRLNDFKEDIFKLYKRFHTHKTGKGLGLYLVRLQGRCLAERFRLSVKSIKE